jgi:hypothetical protein
VPDLLLLAAVLSLAAGAIHFAFAPTHWADRASHGAFFLGVGALQVGWAVAVLVRPSRRLALAGVLQLAVVTVWVASRTVGAPGTNGTEAVGFPDALASAFEVGIAALAGLAWWRRPVVRLRPLVVSAAAVLVAGTTLVSLTPRYAGAGAHTHGVAAAGSGAGAAALSPCEQSGPPVSPAQFNETQGHAHRGPIAQLPIDQPTRVTLAQQQAQARGVALKYPTVADAERAGYDMSTPYIPCIGAHYTKLALIARFDPAAPSELLYDGTQPTSKIVGLSYLVYHPGGAPEGFAGPNDRWHQHNANGGLCFNRDGVVVAGEETTPQQCAGLGGSKHLLPDVWMLHDWIVPGWECSWGVFAPECPELGGHTGASAWS